MCLAGVSSNLSEVLMSFRSSDPRSRSGGGGEEGLFATGGAGIREATRCISKEDGRG